MKIEISYQLFEKSRLTMNISSTPGTNFNIFYLLVNAPLELRKKLKITEKEFTVSSLFLKLSIYLS